MLVNKKFLEIKREKAIVSQNLLVIPKKIQKDSLGIVRTSAKLWSENFCDTRQSCYLSPQAIVGMGWDYLSELQLQRAVVPAADDWNA